VRFLASVTGFTQPITYSGTEVAQKTVDPMSSLSDYYHIILAGSNERDSCSGEKEVFYRARVSETQTKRLHEPADTKVAVSIPVTFNIDRDAARSYSFGEFKRAES